MRISTTELSKAISLALRHEPETYGLRLDVDGWVRIDDLIAGLKRARPECEGLQAENIAAAVSSSKKRRHEIQGDRIRALYGHSTEERLAKTPAEPPAVLYHGTNAEAAVAILREGLKPTSRQYVHLSPDRQTAREVGLRKGSDLVILLVEAERAHREGVAFYIGNETVWLADSVPPQFIREEPS
jgi:putative RNA 2'-phosphotransferase